EQGECPRRARLVVVVAAHEHGLHPHEVDVVHAALLHHPGQRAEALAVGGAPAHLHADPAAGADRLAVAGLEIAAGDVPAHPGISICDGSVSPGTCAGAAA